MNTPAPPPKPETAPEPDSTAPEHLLDQSLVETFPASDPISPGAAEPGQPGDTEHVVDISPPAPPDEPVFPTTERHPARPADDKPAPP